MRRMRTRLPTCLYREAWRDNPGGEGTLQHNRGFSHEEAISGSRRSDVVSRHKFCKATQNIGILLPQKRKIGALNHLNPQRRLIVDRVVRTYERMAQTGTPPPI
jgi:hypothetical protein